MIDRTSWSARIGAALLVGLVALSLLTPLLVSSRELTIDADVVRPSNAAPGSTLGIFGDQGPSSFLGTDAAGRPVHALVLWGMRSAVIVGIVAVAVAILLGVAFGVVAARGPRWLRSAVNVLTAYLQFVPAVVVAIIAVVWLEISGSPTGTNPIFLGGVVLGVLLSVVPFRAIRGSVRRTRERTSRKEGLWTMVRLLTRPAATVFALAVSVWTVVGFAYPYPVSAPSLGRELFDAAYFGELAKFWWLWAPAAVAVVLLILSARMIATSQVKGSSPWDEGADRPEADGVAGGTWVSDTEGSR